MNLEKLTPAPWHYKVSDCAYPHSVFGPSSCDGSSTSVAHSVWTHDRAPTDMAFIALARNAFAGDPEALAWWEANRVREAGK